MKIFKLSIVLIIITLLSMPAWAKFCSECGKPLNEGAKFCSECGNKTGESNGNTVSIKDDSNDENKIMEYFSFIDESLSYIRTSNINIFLDKFSVSNENFIEKREIIEEFEKQCNKKQKILIESYIAIYEVINDFYNLYKPGFDNSFKKMVYLEKCNHLASIFQEFKINYSINKPLNILASLKQKLVIFANTYTVKSKYMQPRDGRILFLNSAKFSILEVNDNEAKLLLLGREKDVGAGCITGGIGLWAYDNLPKSWTPYVKLSEIIKRTDCKKDDLEILKNNKQD